MSYKTFKEYNEKRNRMTTEGVWDYLKAAKSGIRAGAEAFSKDLANNKRAENQPTGAQPPAPSAKPNQTQVGSRPEQQPATIDTHGASAHQAEQPEDAGPPEWTIQVKAKIKEENAKAKNHGFLKFFASLYPTKEKGYNLDAFNAYGVPNDTHSIEWMQEAAQNWLQKAGYTIVYPREVQDLGWGNVELAQQEQPYYGRITQVLRPAVMLGGVVVIRALIHAD